MKIQPKLAKWIKKNFPETKRKEPKRFKDLKIEDFIWIILTFMMYSLGLSVLKFFSPSTFFNYLVMTPLSIFITILLNLKIGFIIITKRKILGKGE